LVSAAGEASGDLASEGGLFTRWPLAVVFAVFVGHRRGRRRQRVPPLGRLIVVTGS
jgi:hypothetical protein